MIRPWLVIVAVFLAAVPGSAEAPRKVLLLQQGPDGHPPDTHEYAAGQGILEKLLLKAGGLAVSRANADEPWREGPELLPKADGAVLFISEGAKWLQADPKRYAAFRELAKRGGGLAVIHWGMGSRDQDNVAGFVDLFGGCHGGPERKYKVVTVTAQLPAAKHAITFGLKPFRVRDEFYYKLWQAKGSEAIVKVDIDGSAETVAWAWERPDGGRSFGFSGLHFHENWGVPEYRRLVTQGVLWTMKQPIPVDGVPAHLDAADLKIERK